MNKKIPHIITLAAIAGCLAIAGNTVYAQTTDSLLADPVDQSAFPQITAQPVDQTVPLGSSVVLSVQANNADGYQWLRNGDLLDGQTNSALVIQSAGINDVGFYSCEVFNGDEMVPTRAASVEVEMTASTTLASSSATSVTAAKATTASALSASATTASISAASLPAGGPIIVYGTPQGSRGVQGTCPGSYAGYINFTKTISQGWGWVPSTGTTTFTAADGSGRTDTKIVYIGKYGDSGCDQTTVTIPNPPPSPSYRFTIYFPNNVPTTNYPIVLTGFNQ